MKKFVRTRAAPGPLLASYTAGVGLDDKRLSLSRWGEPPGAPWEDPEFPPSTAALGDRRLLRAQWRRPHETCARPRYMGDEALGTDEQQTPAEADERAANRWDAEESGCDAAIAAAAAALSLTPRLLARAVPPHSFRVAYTGRFMFRFWVFGEWREVCVDDRLPRRAAGDDFTLPLLEKAYAKLHGSYAALRVGSVAAALQALSGGVLQSFNPLRQPRSLLLRVLHAALPRATLVVAIVRSDKFGTSAKRDSPLPGQAYCVTALARVREQNEALLRLRATGAASQRPRASPQRWQGLSEADQELLESRAEPGDIWMAFCEFARTFSRLELVHVGPDDWVLEGALRGRRPWRAVLARRRWRRGHSAGGPPRAATASANPQFRLSVASGVHAVLSLTQRYTPGMTRLHAIGFAVYELPPSAPRRAALANDSLKDLHPLDVTHESRAREVVTFFTLPPGQYLVVPYLNRPHLEAAFLLRILTDGLTDVWEVNDDNAIVRDIAAEFKDEAFPVPERMRKAIDKLQRTESTDEIDASGLRSLLRRCWRTLLPTPPSDELCRALVAMRDPAVSGRLQLSQLPALLALLTFWKAAISRAPRASCGQLSAYSLRALLWACGVSASNKVLECVVLRHARGHYLAPADAAVALARLHLAHERYRSLEAKMKSNPLSLEEMILMTIYS